MVDLSVTISDPCARNSISVELSQDLVNISLREISSVVDVKVNIELLSCEAEITLTALCDQCGDLITLT